MKIANSPPPNGRMPGLPRGEAPSWGGVRFGNRFVDSSEIAVNVLANVAFRPIRRIGGKTGWYYGDWLWQVRGLLIYWSAASGFAGGGAIQKCFRSVILSISGVLKL